MLEEMMKKVKVETETDKCQRIMAIKNVEEKRIQKDKDQS